MKWSIDFVYAFVRMERDHAGLWNFVQRAVHLPQRIGDRCDSHRVDENRIELCTKSGFGVLV